MRFWAGLLGLCPLFVATASNGATVTVKAPLTCSRGGGGRTMDATVHVPTEAATGSVITVRIDSVSSGRISHFGLNYIYDMTTDYLVPRGTTFVEGSARVVADTGTENVRASARIWHDDRGIHTLLPSRVRNGSSYTPPSFEFQLRIDAAPGSTVALQFVRYQVMANAFLVGNVRTVCTPEPKPFAMTTVRVTAAP
jgi:hypothetical protein